MGTPQGIKLPLVGTQHISIAKRNRMAMRVVYVQWKNLKVPLTPSLIISHSKQNKN